MLRKIFWRGARLALRRRPAAAGARGLCDTASEDSATKSKEDLEILVQKIMADASMRIEGHKDVFSVGTSKAKALADTMSATGVEIPSVDLAAIQSPDDLIEYVWGKISAGDTDESSSVGDGSQALPKNLKFL
mmetsp:Transcript_22654/g.40070  ORF Transcript_22654/g.40070 Transcript_22654/m.40070 type:complete len:133 (-) Transcript_22654:115-513(-)